MPPPKKSLSLHYQDEEKVKDSEVSYIVQERLLNSIYFYQSNISNYFSILYTDKTIYSFRLLIHTTFIILK